MSLLQFVNKVGEVLERGDVVVIASRQPDIQATPGAMPCIEIALTDSAYDTAVCGIVQDLYAEHKPDAGQETEAEPAARPGRKRAQARIGSSQAFTLEELETLDRSKIQAGQVGFLAAGGLCLACKVDADIAPIKAGDLLTTSPTKGHAQKVLDPSKAVGAILGKALGSLKKGKGTVPVLVTIQ